MAVTTQAVPGSLIGTIVLDLDADGTGEMNVRNGAATLYGIFWENAAAATSYLKLWDALSPTVGTTAPDYVFPLAASEEGFIWFDGSRGHRFTTGISYACVTTAGTAGTTNPASDVRVELHTS